MHENCFSRDDPKLFSTPYELSAISYNSSKWNYPNFTMHLPCSTLYPNNINREEGFKLSKAWNSGTLKHTDKTPEEKHKEENMKAKKGAGRGQR
jgi:hypothetical protein